MIVGWVHFLLLLIASSGIQTKTVGIFNQPVHLLMTEEERLVVFGLDTKIPEYEVIMPYQHPKQRFRRSLSREDDFQEDDKLLITLPIKGQDRLITLRQKRDLAIPNMKITIMDEYYAESYAISEHPKCHFRGQIVGKETSAVALSTCNPGEMKGIIHVSPSERYIISPLPKRLRRNAINNTNAENYNHHHVLYKYVGKGSYELDMAQRLETEPQQEEADGNQRMQRDTDENTKTVELAVFTDKYMYSSMSKMYEESAIEEVANLIFGFVNGVELVYDQPSLSVDINFVIVGITILKSSKVGPKISGNILDYLTDFGNWQADINPNGDDNPDHWDHAIMLTRSNLYSDTPDNNAVAGVAWLKRMCNKVYSSSLGEAFSYSAVYIMSHEIGHNLGMDHDGSGNNCDDDSYIMSPFTGEGKTTWSSCSDKALKHYSRGHAARCLNDIVLPDSSLDHRSDLLPGERFSATHQCVYAFGDMYKPYVTSKTPFNDVCSMLWCYHGSYAKQAHPAIDGTTCSRSKICFHGKCEPAEEVRDQLRSKGFLINNSV